MFHKRIGPSVTIAGALLLQLGGTASGQLIRLGNPFVTRPHYVNVDVWNRTGEAVEVYSNGFLVMRVRSGWRSNMYVPAGWMRLRARCLKSRRWLDLNIWETRHFIWRLRPIEAPAEQGKAKQSDPIRQISLQRPQQVIAQNPELDFVVAKNNRFALDLYRQLSSRAAGNLFFSPYSISSALAMTHAGAKGETEKQIARALYFGLRTEQQHSAFKDLRQALGRLNPDRGCRLNVANALWAQQGTDLLPTFVEVVRGDYGAKPGQLDFLTQTETARWTINGWVELQTANAIRELIPAGGLDPRSQLVLVNAIYFKGDWKRPFDKKLTRPSPFSRVGQAPIDVSMMYQKGQFAYASRNAVQVLELPYGRQKDVSLIILLPEKVDGLRELEAKLTNESLADLLSVCPMREVDVFLPRFKLESQFELKPVLQAMGITSAFTRGEADFSGMTGSKGLHLSNVIHKACLDLNEEGTEAAAATAGLVRTVNRATPQFRADRPFLFLIRDNQTGSILFLGRLSDPS